MTADAKLLEQVRAALDGAAVREIKMFGGIGFMLNGNMVAAASSRGLLVRVGEDAAEEALTRPGAAPMVMRGKQLKAYTRVTPEHLDARAVKAWMRLARKHLETLPPERGSLRTPRPTALDGSLS